MRSLLTNKTIFITGATAGFGRECAKLFVSHGAKVVATGRRKEKLSSLRDEVEAIQTGETGSPRRFAPRDDVIYTLPLDVRDKAAVERAVASLPADFAKVDILINNAGLALGLNSYESQAMDDIEQMVDTNIKGVLYCTHALLPGMVKRDRGHIVNLGSIAGTYPYPGGNVYGASKAFLAQFSLNLRADLLGKNIRVTNIEPGMCDTEFSLVRFAGDEAKAQSVYAGMQPLTAEDIANTILWAITQPPHVNINRVEIMPVMQAFSPFAVNRKSS